jgi:nicotinamidase-related amidase
MLLRRARSQLLIIDVQAKLAPRVDRHRRVVANCGRLIAYARRLGVPLTLKEHYPQGIGRTVAELGKIAGSDAAILDKITFSGWQTEAIRGRLLDLREQGRDHVVVAGMEAHVCVLQTCLDILASRLELMLVADAIGSRQEECRQLAIDRIGRAGGGIVSHEMVAFEWLERGATAEFKDLIQVIK